MQEEWELIEQLRRGNKQAYTEIVERYKGKIYAFLYRMIGHSQDAQDLTQEVFIKAYCKIGDYRPDFRFSAWLFRIAANHCLDELRKRKRLPVTTAEESELVHENTPERILLAKEQHEVLHEKLLALEDDHRVILLLRYVEQLSYKEIAEVLSIPVTTVQMRIFRAHKKLRQYMIPVKGGGPVEVREV
ncbi:sigma-70 family RNA polymerase sigma factor [Brevibacillus borstelensis]|uniref:RNA polymerase sigma factor n=1 Tax=Brevibacillus borstelensis TaxID=45462 RepID=UPI00203D135F|nr:sigma-70 family RNA polymerase sigma factor [Brevibacillus borstelensis]MCM3591553.1 sigma-70 family RNA polymerase sigma factor [Brevibacillus borstelensis]